MEFMESFFRNWKIGTDYIPGLLAQGLVNRYVEAQHRHEAMELLFGAVGAKGLLRPSYHHLKSGVSLSSEDFELALRDRVFVHPQSGEEYPVTRGDFSVSWAETPELLALVAETKKKEPSILIQDADGNLTPEGQKLFASYLAQLSGSQKLILASSGKEVSLTIA